VYRLRQGRCRNRLPCRRSARGQRREVQICALAATVEGVAAAAELPVTPTLPVDRTRDVCGGGGVVAGGEPRDASQWPPPPLYSAV
jgi:hypothetical protein